MAYSIEIKEKALALRRKGYSLNEIQTFVPVSKGRLSEWCRNVDLDDRAKIRLLGKLKLGQLVSSEKRKARSADILASYEAHSKKLVGNIKIDNNISLLLCSLLFWCEGSKNQHSSLHFTNSDPFLVKTFLRLFRASFNVDESKFRVCVHLHGYHDERLQVKFWSKITRIPLRQFIKPYHKKNTGKRSRDGYQGCASVRYHDAVITKKLLVTAKVFLGNEGE